MNKDLSISRWNALFSSLAFAEKAAADECKKIAKIFRFSGQVALAERYEGLSIEEATHHELALSVTKNIVPLTARAKLIYDGGLFSVNASVLERLMSVHLVFEPSALAFLGYVARHSNELISDSDWAAEVSTAFKQIVYDEVDHVYSGVELIAHLWKLSTPSEQYDALKTMKKHRAFLKAGLLSFFTTDPVERPAILKMLQRFDFYFEKAMKGVQNAEPTQIAS